MFFHESKISSATHIRVMHLLLDLSMSHYSFVRTHAQNILAKTCKWFSFSYKIIVPRVRVYFS